MSMPFIKIFDTTLRDGEQAPGNSMNLTEKVALAKQLERLGVDVIEAGFPIASPDDFAAVQAIAKICTNAEVCGLARSTEKDIRCAWDAVKEAKKPRIHTFVATSPIHMEHKLRKTPEEVLSMAVSAVKLAKSLCDRVDFSPEDATRSDPAFMYTVLRAAIDAGADTLNIPDTVGYATPREFSALIAGIKEHVVGSRNIIISTHCHDDLGLAVANSLAGVEAGARQIECTINGIGERAGNAALEEVVMALHTRPVFYGFSTGINTKELYPTSRLLTSITGVTVQPNKAIVGANAFAHEAGIHQDGMLKERRTYEIMKPEDVGVDSSSIVLGKHSGRHALEKRLQTLGFTLTSEELNSAFDRFKALADKKKKIFDDDLFIIVGHQHPAEQAWTLKNISVRSGMNETPHASVEIMGKEKSVQADATGDGPIDALFSAIGNAMQCPAVLTGYSVNAASRESDALGTAAVQISFLGQIYSGSGSDTDVIIASGKAYIVALSRALHAANRHSIHASL